MFGYWYLRGIRQVPVKTETKEKKRLNFNIIKPSDM